jgi:GMP reductase
MKIEEDIKLDFADVLIRPKRSTLESRSEVDLTRTFKFKLPNKTETWSGVPIVSANMDSTGTIPMAKALSKWEALGAVHKHVPIREWKDANIDDWLPNAISCNIIYTMGMGSDGSNMKELMKAQEVLKMYPQIKFICLDVANGYTEKFVNYVSHIRGFFPDHILIAGNVVTREMTEALILAGANIVKIGIGPGSVCTTRKVAGVGYPQLSAIMECADAAHGLGGFVMADGGCTCSGDIAKAYGAGADFVMIGGMLAGADEAAGEITENGKVFYGMSSADAMQKYSGGVATYRASEGKKVYVKPTGPVDLTVQEIMGGVRSSCTYVGAVRLKDLPKCTTFVRVNRQLNTVFA